MKFFVNAKTISNALAIVGRAISGKPTQPILGSVKIQISDAQAVLTGFDLSTAIIQSIPVDNLDGDTTVCIPYLLLSTIVAKLDGDLTISQIDNQVVIKSDTGEYTMSLLDSNDYPTLPTVEGEPIKLSGATLREAIATVGSCASDDQSKQVLTGINLQTVDGWLYFNATDGHVLSRFWADGCQDNLSVTIPSHALQNVAKHTSEDVDLVIGDGQVEFESGDLKIIARILDGAYPKVSQLIPKQFLRTAMVDSAQLKAAIGRVSAFADQKNNFVILNFANDKLKVSSQSMDVGQGIETLKCELDGDGIEFAANIKYLSSGINALSAKVLKFSINESYQPVIITAGENSLFLIMPVQVVR